MEIAVDGLLATALAAVPLAVGAFLAGRRLIRARREMRIAVRIGERNRIARELHDSLMQGAQSLAMHVQHARNLLPARPMDAALVLDEVVLQSAQVIDEAQGAIQHMRGVGARGLDLPRLVRKLGCEMRREARRNIGSAMASGIAHGLASERSQLPGDMPPQFHVRVSGEARPLDPLLLDDIYCIVREAVRNAFRHAQATCIDVTIGYSRREFSVVVQDDGVGMPANALCHGRRAGHWGLQGMNERADSFGGRLEFESGAAGGTRVVLRLPVPLLDRMSAAFCRPTKVARFSEVRDDVTA